MNKKKNFDATKLQKDFENCIKSKDNYTKKSSEILKNTFEEDKPDLITKLLMLIEEVLTEQKSGTEERVYAMIMLKDASKQPSKSFLQCVSQRTSLLETLFKIALIDKELVADEKGANLFVNSKKKQKKENESLGSMYIQIAVDCICFWAMNFCLKEPSKEGLLKSLYIKLSNSNVRIPNRLTSFGVEFKEPNDGKQNKQLEQDAEKQPGIRRDNSSNGLQLEMKKSKSKELDELNESRVDTSNKLLSSINEYYEYKRSKARALTDFTNDQNEFIWKTKEILLELNLLKVKTNYKFDQLKRYSNLKEQEKVFLSDIQQEGEKFVEFEQFIDQHSAQSLFAEVLDRAGKFFDQEFIIQETAKGLPESIERKVIRNNTFSLDLGMSSRFQEREKTGIFKIGSNTPAFQLEDSPGFKEIKENNLEQSSPVIQKFDFSEEAQEKNGMLSKGQKKLSGYRNGHRNSLPPYNPEESQEKIKRLMRKNMTVINDLENIKNGIVSSLQQIKKPVPWEAFDGLETIKREYNMHPGKFNSTQVMKTEPSYSPRDKWSFIYSAGLRNELFAKPQNNAQVQQKNLRNSHIESEHSEDYGLEARNHDRLFNTEPSEANNTNYQQVQQNLVNGNQPSTFETNNSKYYSQGQPVSSQANGLKNNLVFRQLPTFAETESEDQSIIKSKIAVGTELNKQNGALMKNVQETSSYIELEKLLLISDLISVDQFCQVACRKKEKIFEDYSVAIDVKYDLVQQANHTRKLLQIILFILNKTKSPITNFKFECAKQTSFTLLQVPEKINLQIPAGKSLKLDFHVHVNKIPFFNLNIHCQGQLQNNLLNEDITFSFIIPVTYNLFMTFEKKISYEQFLKNWKLSNQRVVIGEPKLLTNEAVSSLEDFQTILGELLEYPGMIREDGTPQAYALLGVFELEEKNVEYLLRINWLPDDKIIAFEIACPETHSREAEFILKTLEFLFARVPKRS